MLCEEKNPFAHIFDQIDALSVQGYDENRMVIYWNKGSEDIYGYTQEEALGKKLEDLIIPIEMRDIVISAHSNWILNGEPIPASELLLKKKDGSNVHVYSSHVILEKQDGSKQMFCVDINLDKLKFVEHELKKKQKILETVFQAIPDLLFQMDEKGKILSFYAGNEEDLYIPKGQVIGSNMYSLLPLDVATQFKEATTSLKSNGGMVNFVYDLDINKGRTTFDARLSLLPESTQSVVIIREVTEQKRVERENFYHAHYDFLTGLPNRYLALDRLNSLIKSSTRSGKNTFVFFVDLDDFKKINDTFGHFIGDKALIEVASHLKSSVRDEDTVGRMGGDEFIVLLQGLNKIESAVKVAKKILNQFKTPLSIENHLLKASVSIGIASYPDHASTTSELLCNVDKAMYHAKSLGKNTLFCFSKELTSKKPAREVN